MPLFGKRANLPVANLALLAALVPKHHEVTLLDENVEDIDFERVGRADMVCLTGMSIQGRRLTEIIEELRGRGVMIVVGGPMATVERRGGPRQVYLDGEPDDQPQFLRHWEQVAIKAVPAAREDADVTKLPLPRIDR